MFFLFAGDDVGSFMPPTGWSIFMIDCNLIIVLLLVAEMSKACSARRRSLAYKFGGSESDHDTQQSSFNKVCGDDGR